MTSIEINRATMADAEELAPKLNRSQMKLIMALGDKSLMECFERAVGGSTVAWSGRVNGDLLALWGCYPLQGACGYPWLYSADGISRQPRAALVIAHHAIREMLRLYPRLYGVVDSRFEESVRFARHLGFQIGTHPANPPMLTIERYAHGWR